MSSNLEDLKSKYKSDSPEQTETTAPKKDRFIKGTLLDDQAIEAISKASALFAIIFVGSILYLWLERTIGTKSLVILRIWLPVLSWFVLAFLSKPFLKFGWWGLLCTLAIIPNTSGYLWQFFQGLVGAR